ncbi:branched-chain amino acid transport system II carrier protein [Aquibacillus kalidii]|uniref:branched-chain amino acid transport system II carrier protein n=1 Tax=Aquibacillus kalidii TaxID=2762597 RepID=UPI001646D5D8|nr:branched-chain amino acid transport system II carrier protein [Aquibacillus kalidii]
MNKQTFFIGFMLFALFFGAGNLIYPPTLGIEAGTSYWSAISGFLLTGVGLPILAIVAITISSNQSKDLGDAIHPKFGLIFSSVIYLAIGPFFGIPRAANVAYEIGIVPFFKEDAVQSIRLLFFSIIFFLLVFIFSLNPSKLVDRIGQWLTPFLLLAIISLGIGGFLLLDSPWQAPSAKYEQNAFFTGFIEGYATMDAIGAIAFGIIVITSFKQMGIQDPKEMIKSTLKAGLVAGSGLVIVYSMIGWIGVKMASTGTYTNGGQVLSVAAELILGNNGRILLGVIVVLACFTTSIGLAVACGQFFSRKTPLSYRGVIAIVTIVSFLITNLGLNQIIAISIPILVMIYPVAMTLIVLTLINQPPMVVRFAVLFTAFISIFEGLMSFGLTLSFITPVLESMPFHSIGLGWVIPTLIGGIIGRVMEYGNRQHA